MGIIEQLRHFETFTTTEKAIVRTIFQDPEILSGSTSQELAEASFTSTSSVARLCKKLGCKNYHDFCLQFLSEYRVHQRYGTLAEANMPFDAEDDVPTMLKKLTNLQKQALDETLADMDLDSYQKAVELLSSARLINVYGSGVTLHAAYDFAYKLRRIGLDVYIEVDYQGQVLSARNADIDSCALIISYTGENPQTVHCAEILHQNETPIVAITSEGPSSIASLADAHLCIAALEQQYSKIGPFASNASVNALLNYLYAGVFAQNYEENYDLLLSSLMHESDFLPVTAAAPDGAA